MWERQGAAQIHIPHPDADLRSHGGQDIGADRRPDERAMDDMDGRFDGISYG